MRLLLLKETEPDPDSVVEALHAAAEASAEAVAEWMEVHLSVFTKGVASRLMKASLTGEVGVSPPAERAEVGFWPMER